ncbi:MAG: STAS domain-containing protein [Gaiellales bacterium]
METSPQGLNAYVAVVRLHGGHDIATSRNLREALDQLEGSVLLDLSDCGFIDSSVIYVIFSDAHTRSHQKHHLELLVPPENRAITRTLEIAGAREVLTVHRSSPAG